MQFPIGLQEKLFHIWLNSFFVAGGERGELKFEHHTSSRSATDGDMDGAMNRASAPMSDSSRIMMQETSGETGQSSHSPQQTTWPPLPGDPLAPCTCNNARSAPTREAHVHGPGCLCANANHQCPVCNLELVTSRPPMDCDLSCETCGGNSANANRSSPTQTPAPAPTAAWPFVGSTAALSTDVLAAVGASRSPDIQKFPQKRADRSSDILLDFYKCDLDRAHKDRNDKTLPKNFQVTFFTY